MRYKHDCTSCTSLDTFGDYDLYFCTQGVGGNTIVARYGNKGKDYLSGIGSQHYALVEGEKRAKERNLIE